MTSISSHFCKLSSIPLLNTEEIAEAVLPYVIKTKTYTFHLYTHRHELGKTNLSNTTMASLIFTGLGEKYQLMNINLVARQFRTCKRTPGGGTSHH